jgi:nicotinamidase-related amidase
LRLPADATLIIVGAQEAIDHMDRAEGLAPGVDANLASLIAAWRKEGLPVVHVRLCDEPDHPFKAFATPLEGEAVIDASAASAFAASELEDLLDAAGATTVVLCGSLNAVEPSARDAANLGYQIFIPFDTCWPAVGPAEPAVSRLRGETAVVVSTAAALDAAATAKARQRRDAERRR